MKVLDENTHSTRPLCLALGFFDCVHLGHKTLLTEVKRQAKDCAAESCAITFTGNPYTVLRKGTKQVIFTFEERLELFAAFGLDCVLALPFTETLKNRSKEAFLRDLLDFDLRGIVCGYDYRFGAKAAGDTEYLREFCQNYGIMCNIVQPVVWQGERVSSTMIRKSIQNGDMKDAAMRMGHPYFAEGIVRHGRGVGKAFGFPTANLQVSADKLLPLFGVYATVTTADGKRYVSVTNVGSKPTFGDDSVTVETLLRDFEGDLYGKKVRVEFVRRLRDIQAFSDPEALRKQIYKDMEWKEN